MLRVYKKALKDRHLRELRKPEKGCWIDLVDPIEEEVNRVLKFLNVPEDFVYSVLDEDEKPRVEKEGKALLVIIRVPTVEDVGSKRLIRTLPLGIIITKTAITTVCLKEVEILYEFYVENVKNFFTTKRVRFFLQILKLTNQYYSRYLEMIEKEIEGMEKAISRALRNEEILRLLELQKTLIFFNTGIMGNQQVFKRVMEGKLLKLYEEDKDVLEDIIIDGEQALGTSKILSDILSNTLDAYASIVSNNLSMIMKFLTSLTIILSIPTIISSFYGMNVALPLQKNPNAFLIVSLISLIVSSLLFMIFWKRRWI